MRVFDFDGTIYDGESLFDLYLFSVRYEPKVLRYIAPVLNCGIRYKIGKAEPNQMERKLDNIVSRYVADLEHSRRLERQARRCGVIHEEYAGNSVVESDIADMPQDIQNGLDALSRMFWDRRFRRIKSWYEPRPDDVIVTASFDRTIGEACRRLGLTQVIASTIDPQSLEISHLNFGLNKVRRFHEVYGDVTIDEFYTDSRHDQPMIDIARTAYLVKGDKVIRIK